MNIISGDQGIIPPRLLAVVLYIDAVPRKSPIMRVIGSLQIFS